MNENQTGIGGIILKLIVLVGVSGYFIWKDWGMQGAIQLETLKAAIMMAVIAYLLISLYIILIKSNGSFLISLLLLVGLAVLVGMGFDKLIKKGILTDESSLYMVLIIGLLLIFYDIRQLVKCFKPRRQSQPVLSYDEQMRVQSNTGDFKQYMKDDAQTFLDFSYQLEQKLKRKPTANEVMNYIDSLEIEDHGLAEQLYGKRTKIKGICEK